MIQIHNIQKTYVMGEARVHALRGVDLTVKSGEFVAIMGASGSGKSTLMNTLGCLDRPSSGEYLLSGKSVGTMNKNGLADLRNEIIGFVFQGFNLLAKTSALENVELPLLYSRKKNPVNMHERAISALTAVGLEQRIHHEPSQLSGGQQQRIAIARALVNDPQLILADEPTGNLDTRTSIEIMAIFQQLNDKGITVVLVTHENDIAAYAKRLIEMRDGRIIKDTVVSARRNAQEELTALGAVAPDED
jgi:putative ABC transport system ATP-binding protein